MLDRLIDSKFMDKWDASMLRATHDADQGATFWIRTKGKLGTLVLVVVFLVPIVIVLAIIGGLVYLVWPFIEYIGIALAVLAAGYGIFAAIGYWGDPEPENGSET
jgi:nitrate reductase NapE component